MVEKEGKSKGERCKGEEKRKVKKLGKEECTGKRGRKREKTKEEKEGDGRNRG